MKTVKVLRNTFTLPVTNGPYPISFYLFVSLHSQQCSSLCLKPQIPLFMDPPGFPSAVCPFFLLALHPPRVRWLCQEKAESHRQEAKDLTQGSICYPYDMLCVQHMYMLMWTHVETRGQWHQVSFLIVLHLTFWDSVSRWVWSPLIQPCWLSNELPQLGVKSLCFYMDVGSPDLGPCAYMTGMLPTKLHIKVFVLLLIMEYVAKFSILTIWRYVVLQYKVHSRCYGTNIQGFF